MKVVPVGSESKHLFEKIIDTEQVFVMRYRHDEHRFDKLQRRRPHLSGVTPDT